ncbi:hypothetical protein HUJ05_003396 [Dendroctonus ponderosae]|nr:hypothetical protein HUJ05_003396 [Dendroctonus ponderosae]
MLVTMKLSLFQSVIFVLSFRTPRSMFRSTRNETVWGWLNSIYATVKVSVFYETLCPDCIAFITNQLHPNYKAFGSSLIDLQLIPCGFEHESVVNGSKIFICQHGQNECYGNRVHGCVIALYSITISESFAACSESSDNPASKEALQSCASSNQISWPDIEMCISSIAGEKIMEANEKITAQLNPRSVPTVVFNGGFNENDANQSIDDLKGVICKYLNNNPPQCRSNINPSIIVL